MYPASAHIIATSKNEEGAWTQQIMSDHKLPITSLALDSSGRYAASGDRVVTDDPEALSSAPVRARINLWDVTTASVLGTMKLPESAVGKCSKLVHIRI